MCTCIIIVYSTVNCMTCDMERQWRVLSKSRVKEQVTYIRCYSTVDNELYYTEHKVRERGREGGREGDERERETSPVPANLANSHRGSVSSCLCYLVVGKGVWQIFSYISACKICVPLS